MKRIEVRSKAEIADFHKVPHLIYKNDKNWIPHLKQDIEKAFDRQKNKAYINGDAVRWILKDNTGKLIGRIAAFINGKTAHSTDMPTGGCGFFECINDQDAANLLFDSSREWLKERGMEAMDGPVNFGEKDQFWGLLVENFTDPNSYGMNYNLPYYQQLFETYGFQLYFNQHVFKRDLYVPAQPIFVRKYNQMNADPDYRISNVRGYSDKQLADDFRTVYNGAWGGHHGFKKMPEKNAHKIVKALKPIMDPDIIVFVYYKNQPIAFYINIPEMNEIFKSINGNLNLMNKLRVWWMLKRKVSRTMVGIVFGVVREFHGKGIEGAMIKWTEENIVTLKRYDETVLVWIGDFNPKMIKVCENLGAVPYRKLITYRYLFDRTKPFERCPIVE